MSQPRLELNGGEPASEAVLRFSGDWCQGSGAPLWREMQPRLAALQTPALCLDGADLDDFDALLVSFLLRCINHCRERGIEWRLVNMPDSVGSLLEVATVVPPHTTERQGGQGWLAGLEPARLVRAASREVTETLHFIGEVVAAYGQLLIGRANTRAAEFRAFSFQNGPSAFGIITLTSVLVGMILGYLGAVQLQQFGAGIYVADLVVIGMLREMGALMTAVVLAGRTGAAYAAQLGTMQTNEEIDAIRTLGISPVEFLVLPRISALVMMMPLMTIYANVLGILGGSVVASGLGITPLQYVSEARTVMDMTHVWVGLVKSVIFAALIGLAGCQSGMNSGRTSAAVGEAATRAVVRAVIYLIAADAAVNIVCMELDI